MTEAISALGSASTAPYLTLSGTLKRYLSSDFPSGLERFTVNHPDGTEDTDCQCARCGSSVYGHPCGECGGDGEVLDTRDWALGGLTEEYVRCRTCKGSGEYVVCASGSEWCEEHPMPGRENVIGA